MIRTVIGVAIAASCITGTTLVYAAQIDIVGPLGSGEFGKQVYLLPHGNFVVTDPGFDASGGAADVGAVYLYRADGGLIHTLRGSSTGDQIGSLGITVLSNGHFVVSSPDWDNVGVFDAGAATWRNGWSGSDTVVSTNNSLVGSSASNRVSGSGVVALSNGNYVIDSPEWDNIGVINAGAATWANGFGSSSGVVGLANSLIGSQAEDQVGATTPLTNGNYVVASALWDNGAMADAGAATWGDGANGTSGVVGIGNSLIGAVANDEVAGQVFALRNGHYVVDSYHCDNGSIDGAGAVTWGNGFSGTTGVVSASNSLVGGTADDILGQQLFTLNNGHYVVGSYIWDNAGIVDAGVMAWVDGTAASTGVLNPANALMGSSPGDHVGKVGITELSNGNYVVISYDWDNGGIVDAGAVTWRNGSGGGGALVSASNSLVGSSLEDHVGRGGVAALSNGHYVVSSPYWRNAGLVFSGAATWRNGAGGSGAVVSTGNSLVSNQANSAVGLGGVTALSNGHYVVSSPYWDNGSVDTAGAVTWRNGSSGSGALISAANSLVGSSVGDFLGNTGGVTALNNDHYAIRSSSWDNGAVQNVGAVTWRNGSNASSGTVSASNSLVGSVAADSVGNGVLRALANSNYIAFSSQWDNGAIVDAGAVSLGLGTGTTVGPITAANSVRGTAANGGISMNYTYDSLRAQLIVGRPASNTVSLLRPGAVTSASITLDTPDASDPGQVVTFVTTIVASPAPSNGTVRVNADTGETCTDNSPTPTSPTTADFSCQILFANVGTRSMRAEFLGTNTHGYSASGPESHSVSVPFANGFE